MSKRTYTKITEVTCPNDNCPQKEDAFQVRYEVEEEDGSKIIVGRKAIPEAEDGPALVVSPGYGWLNHPCPWCGVTSRFRMPL